MSDSTMTRPSDALDTEGDFDGSEYDRGFDHDRLSGQLRDIYDVMSDGRWRTLREIQADCFAMCGRTHLDASISKQLRHLRYEKFGAYSVEKRIRGERSRGIWEYRVGDAGTHTPATRKSILQLLGRIEELEEVLKVVAPNHPVLTKEW